MKKNALAISIALLCAAPSFATASVWGRSPEGNKPPEKQAATPEVTTIGFLGRMVSRSHDNQPSIPPSTLPSLTGSNEPTTLVELQHQPDFATPEVAAPKDIAPIVSQVIDTDPALAPFVPNQNVNDAEVPKAQMVAVNDDTRSAESDSSISESQTADAETQVDTSALSLAAAASTESKPSLFHRFLDYIVPSVTPEQEPITLPEKTKLATEVLPVKNLPIHMPAPEKAILLVDGPIPEDSAAQETFVQKNEIEKQEKVFVLSSLRPIHTQLQEWATESGWTLDWKLSTSWIAPVDTTFSGTYQSVIESIIDGLHSEGKQLKLIVWANNYAEVVDVSTR